MCRLSGITLRKSNPSANCNPVILKQIFNRKQHTSINHYDSNLAIVKFGVLEGPVLDPLFFLIYIRDFKQSHKILWIQPLCQWQKLTWL